MAIINSYPLESNPKLNDSLVLIKTIENDSESTSNVTKTVSLSSVKTLVSDGDIKTVQKTITAAQLGDLSGTDVIELVAAPGANKVLVPVYAICFLDYNSEAYNFSANLEIASKTSPLGALPTAQLNASSDTYFAADLFAAGIVFEDNQPLNLFANSTTVSTGDSPLKIEITYKIVDFS